jgi:CheY-like chemotaxis protein
LNADVKRFVILLVEDEPADANLVKAALSANQVPAELRHVFDGREALEYLHREGRFSDVPRPDLILLDLNMPRMDGRECLVLIKQDDALRDIPVVILTTSEAERDVFAAYSLGAVGYITKPADVLQFFAAMRNLGDYWIKLVRLPRKAGGLP